MEDPKPNEIEECKQNNVKVVECKQSSDSAGTISDESEEIDYEDDPNLTREENEF